jgi:TP901 family phage tail tape measure protein
MNIQIRVLSKQAQDEMRQMRARVRELEAELATANRAATGFGTGGIRALEKWGSQVQWAGRQLTYNFTLPIALAIGSATKFALANEAAMTRIKKVYGDGVRDAHFYAKEIDALGRAFEALSNKFGVARADVQNIAADWAAAGSSGLALAKATKLTIETMILGELEAETATKALISIQAQYNMSTQGLIKTIDILNMVENQTGSSMGDLIDGFQRAAGVARSAGIDVRHLAAMIASLTPAAGSASQAGNAIKTIVSRLLSPTKEAAEVMTEMGIAVHDMSWQSLNGTQRLEAMAKAFVNLDDGQKAAVSSVVASRWQINKFDVLMVDMAGTLGYYRKALEATTSATANQIQREKELTAVLNSSPQKFKQIITIMQNVAADAIVPLIPELIRVGHALAAMFTWFGNLPPEVKKLSIAFLVLLAVIGPIMRLLGSFATLFGYLAASSKAAWAGIVFLTKGLWLLAAAPFKFIWAGLTAIATAMTGPWGIAVAVAVGMFFLFREQLTNIWNSITDAFQQNSTAWAEIFAPVVRFFQDAVGFIERAFWRLPQGVRDALLTVVRLVQQAAEATQRMFANMFSFAGGGGAGPVQKHASGGTVTGPGTGTSDSVLIAASNGEEVINAYSAKKHRSLLKAINADRFATGGTVGDAQKKLSSAGPVASNVSSDLAAYKKISDSMNGIQWNKEMATVSKGFASALPLFKRLLADFNALNAQLLRLEASVNRQQSVVDAWKAKLDAANIAVDTQQMKLDGLQKKLDGLTTQYAKHEEALQGFANAPIQGMQAMSDSIFDNQMAQKKLQLQMLQWEKQHGSIDKVKNSMALLQGEIEKMQGNIKDLRASGAGSDITGPLEEQVKSMKDQYDQMGDTVNNSPISKLQEQLDALAQQGQILDLENSLKFDPLTRQVDQLANGMKELPFDQIIAGITKEQAAMAALQPQIDQANAAVEKQKAVVDEAIKARDAIQLRYDTEVAKLDKMKNAYQQVEDAVRQVEDAMRGLATAAQDSITKANEAKERAKAISPGLQNFRDAEGANFPEVGEGAKIGREGGLADQAKLIDEFTKKLTDELSFNDIDMFAPIKDMWNKGWAWMEREIKPGVTKVWNAIKSTWSSLVGTGLFDDLAANFKGAWEGIQVWWSSVVEGFRQLWLLFGDDFKMIFQAIGDFFKRIWTEVGPLLGELFAKIMEALPTVWELIQAVAKVLGGALLLALRVVSGVISQVFGPVLNTVVDVLKAIIQVAIGVIDFFVGVFTMDLQKVGDAVLKIFGGLWDAVFAIFNGAIRVVLGIVHGLVDGVFGFFKWLADMVTGDNSVLDNFVRDAVKWFNDAKTWISTTVANLVIAVVKFFTELPGKVYTGFIDLKNQLSLVATTSFNLFWEKAKGVWASTISWIKGLPKAAWDGLIQIKNNLSQIGTDAWNAFWSAAKAVWATINVWMKNIPQDAWNAVVSLKDKLVKAAGDAFGGFFTTVKSWWDGPKGILAWFSGIPTKIGTALSGVGGTVAGIVKEAWNAAARWVNVNAIKPLNMVTTKFGLNIPYLPGFKDGGIIPGGKSAHDNMIVKVRSGEGVLIPEAVETIGGKKGLESLNKAAKRGGNIQDWLSKSGVAGEATDFGIGGSLFENVTNWLKQGAGFAVSKIMDPAADLLAKAVPRPEMLSKFMSGSVRQLAAKARTWGQGTDADEAAKTGLIGLTPEQVAIINAAGTYFPVNGPITAGYGYYPNSRRPHNGIDFGVPTGTNVKAWRGGRVIKSGWDTTGYGNYVELQHANGTISRYGHNSYLLRQVGDVVRGGSVISKSGNTGNSTGPHVHFGIKKDGMATDPWPYLTGKKFDTGGYLKPGMTSVRNDTGRPEPVFTADQWAILSRLVATSSTVLKSVADARADGPMGLRGSAATSFEARLRRLEGTSSVKVKDGGNTTVNLYGDLVLPNIKSGEDADAFIKNLESLAG